MGDDILDLLEAVSVDFPTDRAPVRRLMGAHLVAVISGKFYNLQERPIPLATLEVLGCKPFDTIPAPAVFPLFLFELECTAYGLTGLVCWPATPVVDTRPDGWPPTLWEWPAGDFYVPLNGWGAWLQTQPGALAASVIGARGLDAYRAFVEFRAWAAPQNADRIIEYHEADGGELADWVALSPDVAGQPALRNYGADLSLKVAGGKRRGVGQRGADKAVDKRRVVIELVALAGVIRERDGLSSWEKAYEAACRARPGWVPKDWADPVDRIKKGVAALRGTCWENIRNTI